MSECPHCLKLSAKDPNIFVRFLFYDKPQEKWIEKFGAERCPICNGVIKVVRWKEFMTGEL